MIAWIPTWALGRQFANGKSVDRRVRQKTSYHIYPLCRFQAELSFTILAG